MKSEHAYDGNGVCMLCYKTRAEGGECKSEKVREREAQDKLRSPGAEHPAV